MLKCCKDLKERVVEYSSHVSEVQRHASLEMFRSAVAKVRGVPPRVLQGLQGDCEGRGRPGAARGAEAEG